MKYDIYFHNDFDGRASAAVMLAFLRSRGDDVEHFAPIDFHLQDQWLNKQFFEKHKLFRGKRNPAVVVDFFYHPKAAWWFDHHVTTFKREGWQKRFKSDKRHVLGTRYLSCAHLVYASLKRNFDWKPPLRVTRLVEWADVIDGAKYKSPRQTIDLKEPALMVDAFIDETRNDPRLAPWMVQLLADQPFADIAALPRIKRVVKRIRRAHLKSLRFYKKNMKVFGDATFIDLTRTRAATLRYASYHLFPKVRYGVRFALKGPLYHVGIGANPWSKKPSIHIGKFLRRYGGGGHKGAGAVDFKSRAVALQAIPSIIKFLDTRT